MGNGSRSNPWSSCGMVSRTSGRVGSSCRFGRQWYAIVAFGSFLVSVVSDVGLW